MIVNNFCFLIVFTRPTSPHDPLSLGLGQLMRLFPQFLVSILYRNRTQYVTFQMSRKTYIFIIWEVENRTNPMWFCFSKSAPSLYQQSLVLNTRSFMKLEFVTSKSMRCFGCFVTLVTLKHVSLTSLHMSEHVHKRESFTTFWSLVVSFMII